MAISNGSDFFLFVFFVTEVTDFVTKLTVTESICSTSLSLSVCPSY